MNAHHLSTKRDTTTGTGIRWPGVRWLQRLRACFRSTARQQAEDVATYAAVLTALEHRSEAELDPAQLRRADEAAARLHLEEL